MKARGQRELSDALGHEGAVRTGVPPGQAGVSSSLTHQTPKIPTPMRTHGPGLRVAPEGERNDLGHFNTRNACKDVAPMFCLGCIFTSVKRI